MHRVFTFTWLAVILLGWVTSAPAAATNSPWFARAWQSDEGLPDNTVVGVEQTPDGFLWVATQAGLVRFDGLQFRQFTPVTLAGAPTSLIQAIFVDQRGRLWVAKDRRSVVCVEPGGISAVTGESGVPNAEARMMVADAEGSLWVSYIGGEVVRLRDHQIRSYTAEDGLPGGSTCQLATDQRGQLWFSQGGWLGVYRFGLFQKLEKFRGQRIVPCRAGGIWVCTGKQLYKYSEGAPPVRVGELPARGKEVNPTVLFEDRAGQLWIGTREAGLFRYDGKGFETVITSHHEILSILEDREGNFWVGTRGGGLNQLKPRVVELLATDPAIPFEGVRSVCQDTEGRIWSVAQNGVVSLSADGGWSALSTNQGWYSAYAQCVAADPAGGVWIGTQYSGLFRWRAGVVVDSVSRVNGLGGDLVSALHTTPAGVVWVGSESVDAQQHTLTRWQEGRMQAYELPPRSGPIVAITSDVAHNCWAATSGGILVRVREGELTFDTRSTLPGDPGIRCLFAAADGSVWIGYAGEGVGRLRAGRFTHFRQEQGLHDDYISQIIPDGRGRLWFAGNRGIFHVREADFAEVAEGRAARVRSVAYGQNEGLPRLQASHDFWPGALQARDGRLWFAMQSGLASVAAPELRENRQPPPVVIERVTVNGRPLAAYGAGELAPVPGTLASLVRRGGEGYWQLAPGQRQVDIEFTALGLMMPESTGFRYRLQGREWTEAGAQRVAPYPQLPPGDYHFQVTACDGDGLWNETGASLLFTISPYWWEAAWFRVVGPLATFGLLGGGVLAGIRRRHRRQIEHLELLQATERERTRIAQDLHDDLGAGLTQISLNSAMAQNPAVAAEVAAGMLQEIDQRSRELVTALDEIVWAVNPKNDTVASLARYLCQFAQNLLLPAEITCRLEVPPVLPDAPVSAEQRHQLFLAFKEALHNTLRHSGARELRLTVAAGPQHLTVTLADNGCGFAPGPVREGADGLTNMQMRLARLGGRCTVTSVPGQGTRVSFDLPLTSGIP